MILSIAADRHGFSPAYSEAHGALPGLIYIVIIGASTMASSLHVEYGALRCEYGAAFGFLLPARRCLYGSLFPFDILRFRWMSWAAKLRAVMREPIFRLGAPLIFRFVQSVSRPGRSEAPGLIASARQLPLVLACQAA